MNPGIGKSGVEAISTIATAATNGTDSVTTRAITDGIIKFTTPAVIIQPRQRTHGKIDPDVLTPGEKAEPQNSQTHGSSVMNQYPSLEKRPLILVRENTQRRDHLGLQTF